MAYANPKGHSNRLIYEKSPYLLQHAGNPVDWYPWGEDAFARAEKEKKPIFLSIGYATCHWCHVMAHESFEDDEVALLLNRYYIAIKVDREERPDVDKIYMSVCQSLTGRGGWPLSIFMTPEGKPFFAGSYFPKSSRMGMPGFMDVLKQVAAMWQDDRSSIVKAGDNITSAIQPKSYSAKDTPAGIETLKKGYTQLARTFDPIQGGFGAAPRFPTPHHLTFLLRWHKRSHDSMSVEMVEKTLDAMRRGGIFDQIGFGFHRYSVDDKWLVPHFEKMLYDQALLTIAYTEAYQATGKVRFARVAREIFTYVLRDMTDPEGGFYSAEDADSGGKEGLFYVWTPREVKEHIGKELGDLFCRFYDITEAGNFEDGCSIPNMRMSLETFAAKKGMELKKLETALKNAGVRLFDARKRRVHPLKDDKILTSWNGLMIAAFAKGFQVFGDQMYADAAGDAAGFILRNLKRADGRLLRRYRQGDAAHPGYLDDYAFLTWGLIELYEATFKTSYLEEAIALNEAMIDIFRDKQGGGLYFTGKGNKPLITRSKDIYDGALPSGNSVAALNLLRLGRLTGNINLEKKADQLIRVFAAEVAEHPMAYTQMLVALDFMVGPSLEIVIAGDPSLDTTHAMLGAVRRRFLPNKVLLLRLDGAEGKRLAGLSPFVEPMHPVDHQPAVYLCEQYSCKKPITRVSDLESALH
ncbi:MAG: thioredoxin domain-containing protein [Deltaproteobacteria bacterium]|nr:thioredoxin domain-containing protein [Deltaproteobacteria bacterium]